MDFDRLRYYCVVAETGSLRRASEILRISPPALSKALRILESECGQRLLVPSGRGIAVTDEGRAFAARARTLLADLRALHGKHGNAAGQGRTASGVEMPRPLRLGSIEVFSTYVVGPLVQGCLPVNKPLVLHELVAGHLERALIEREVDIGITYVAVPSAEITHVEVAMTEMGIFCRRDVFRDCPFSELPFAAPVTPLSGAPDRIRGLDGWPGDAVPRLVRYEVTLMESALELCRQGLAAAFLPRYVARLHNERVREELRMVPWELSARLPGTAGAITAREARALLKSSRQPVYLLRRRSDPESLQFRALARGLRRILVP